MSEKATGNNNTPDRARPGEDIPTYRPPQASGPQVPGQTSPAPENNAYQRAGRAVPQRIEPVTNRADAPTAVFQSPNQPGHKGADIPSQDPGYAAAGHPDTAATTAIPTVSGPIGQQPGQFADPAQPPAAPVAAGYDPTAVPGQPVAAQPVAVTDKRGTIDFGLFLLRLFFGALLSFNALAVLFDFDGSGGLSALEEAFGGYAWPGALAIGLTSVELAAGVFLLLGLLTPFAAALAVVVTSFAALDAIAVSAHSGNPLLWEDTVWLAVVLVVLALVMLFTGPGRVSADFSRGWAKRPLVSPWIFFVIGAAGAAALWWFAAGTNPLLG